MKNLFLSSVAVCLLIGCESTTPSFESISCGYSQLDADTVVDEIPLKSPMLASIQDMALTFPVYEMGSIQTKQNLLRGDASVKSSESRWLLEGDGAQTSIELIRVSPASTIPLRVVLKVGPKFNGIHEDDFVYEYEFERIEGGWRKLSARKSRDSPLLVRD